MRFIRRGLFACDEELVGEGGGGVGAELLLVAALPVLASCGFGVAFDEDVDVGGIGREQPLDFAAEGGGGKLLGAKRDGAATRAGGRRALPECDANVARWRAFRCERGEAMSNEAVAEVDGADIGVAIRVGGGHGLGVELVDIVVDGGDGDVGRV